ncbi:MAG: hypothetical protein U1F11_11430 [Steroidobacteraceae bacterium]
MTGENAVQMFGAISPFTGQAVSSQCQGMIFGEFGGFTKRWSWYMRIVSAPMTWPVTAAIGELNT